jgi:Ca2+-binding EF-hand superfamily protein
VLLLLSFVILAAISLEEMGCACSTSKIYMKGKRKSTTEKKVIQALLKKRLEHAVEGKPPSFEKILLKFDKLRVVLGYVRAIFNEVADDGKLNNAGLQTSMQRLGVNMTLEDILDLFDFIDVQEVHIISIKEFLVALTIGMVLDVIPAFTQPESEPDTVVDDPAVPPRPKKLMIRRSFSGLLGHNNEIKEMLNLIVSVYLMFDPDGKGYIEKKNVESMMDEHGDLKRHNNVMLSQQRWNEMVSCPYCARCLFVLT